MDNTYSSPVLQYVNALRQEVDAALDVATKLPPDSPPRLTSAIRYSLLTPGKRLRPLLVLAATELCNGNRKRAIPAACAVEMVHAYSLIHDDLPAMDDDDLRRGLPTCHKKFDEPTAILAGDALLALAFEMIGSLTPPELAGTCCLALAQAAGPRQLVGGQMDDVALEKSLDLSLTVSENVAKKDLMEQIHHRKTGAMFRVSLRLGALIASATPEQLDALDDFGTRFGLAFQITDDLLDACGEEQLVGKRLHKDAGKDKLSYTTVLGVEAARSEARRVVDAALACLEKNDFDQTSLACRMFREVSSHLLSRNT